MLCGGLQVRGIYCFTFGSELLNKLSTSFQHILKSICHYQQQHHQLQEKSQNQPSEEKKKFLNEQMILLTSVFGSEKYPNKFSFTYQKCEYSESLVFKIQLQFVMFSRNTNQAHFSGIEISFISI
jgi:hypothetical protein